MNVDWNGQNQTSVRDFQLAGILSSSMCFGVLNYNQNTANIKPIVGLYL